MSMKFSSEKYKEFNREKVKTLVNPTRLRKTSTVKSQPGAPAAPTPGIPGIPGVANDQGTSGAAPQNDDLPDIVMESDGEEEEEGASPLPNPAGEGQTQGGTANPAGEGQAPGNTATPTGAA